MSYIVRDKKHIRYGLSEGQLVKDDPTIYDSTQEAEKARGEFLESNPGNDLEIVSFWDYEDYLKTATTRSDGFMVSVDGGENYIVIDPPDLYDLLQLAQEKEMISFRVDGKFTYAVLTPGGDQPLL